MSREELILAGIVNDEGMSSLSDEVVKFASDEELVIICYGRIMDTEEFKQEVLDEDILTYWVHEDEGYVKVSTMSEVWAEEIAEELLDDLGHEILQGVN